MNELTMVGCEDLPGITPYPPDAPFDFLHGCGYGTFNGTIAGIWCFGLTDAGEPGTADTAYFMAAFCWYPKLRLRSATDRP